MLRTLRFHWEQVKQFLGADAETDRKSRKDIPVSHQTRKQAAQLWLGVISGDPKIVQPMFLHDLLEVHD